MLTLCSAQVLTSSSSCSIYGCCINCQTTAITVNNVNQTIINGTFFNQTYQDTTTAWNGNHSLYSQFWYNMTTTGGSGNPFDQWLNTTDNVTFASVNFTSAILLGDASSVDDGIAIGNGASVTGTSGAIAIGNGAVSAYYSGTSVGGGASTNDYGVAIGYGASAGGSSVAVGASSTAVSGYATAIGYGANAGNAPSLALGYGATTNQANQIMFPSGWDMQVTTINGISPGSWLTGENDPAFQSWYNGGAAGLVSLHMSPAGGASYIWGDSAVASNPYAFDVGGIYSIDYFNSGQLHIANAYSGGTTNFDLGAYGDMHTIGQFYLDGADSLYKFSVGDNSVAVVLTEEGNIIATNSVTTGAGSINISPSGYSTSLGWGGIGNVNSAWVEKAINSDRVNFIDTSSTNAGFDFRVWDGISTANSQFTIDNGSIRVSSSTAYFGANIIKESSGTYTLSTFDTDHFDLTNVNTIGSASGTIDFGSNTINTTGTGNLGELQVNGNTNITGDVVIEGNVSIKRPYGMFSSTEDQTIVAPNTAYPITFNWTEDTYQVYKSSDNSNFSFGQTGDYLIELSAIFVTDTNNKHIEIWVQKNGANVPRSNTHVEIPNSGAEQVVSVPFIIDMNMTDSFRVMMASDDAGSTLVYTQNTTHSPMSPSIIMTISKISEITP